MKRLLTISTMLVSSLAMGQMPYNPDADGDALIGAQDLISFLGVYNTLMIDSSLTCDFEGTEFEEFIVGLVDASLVLDSVYVEYLIYDTISYYVPGCPDLVYEPVVLERSYMMTNTSFDVNPTTDVVSVDASAQYLGYLRDFSILYYGENNRWHMNVRDFEMPVMTSRGFRSKWADMSEWPDSYETFVLLPFPEGWSLDEDGIDVDWLPWEWAGYSEHFRLIPFWHEAE